jgi:multicomponent Na+:H+ antiporter subunit B
VKLLSWLALLAFGALMLAFVFDLPPRGDAASPPNTHVSPDYLTNAEHDMETPNVVTAVLADYRGYDTLGETTVIFAAGLACLLVLYRRQDASENG